jgi:ATP-dependent protease HslVU (ClpYQ) peptidase subunit
MTVIAWDGTSLCADKRCGTDLIRSVVKIRRTKSGALIGAAGPSTACVMLMDWYEAGADPSTWPESQKVDTYCCMIVVGKDRIVRVYFNNPVSIKFEEGQHAIGSGRDYAMMAMHLGLSSFEAVKATMLFDAACGNGITELKL